MSLNEELSTEASTAYGGLAVLYYAGPSWLLNLAKLHLSRFRDCLSTELEASTEVNYGDGNFAPASCSLAMVTQSRVY